MAKLDPDAEWTAANQGGRIYAWHVVTLALGVASFVGAIVLELNQAMFAVSGVFFIVSGVTALRAGRSLVTFGSGNLKRAWIQDDAARAKFEDDNASASGAVVLLLGIALLLAAIGFAVGPAFVRAAQWHPSEIRAPNH